MTMAAIGASVAVGVAGSAASYGLSQMNKPKGYNPAANNALAAQQQQQLAALAQQYQSQVSGYGTTFLNAEQGLANTYSTQGTGASTNYLGATGTDLNNYSTNIANLAAGAPQNELNAANAGLGFNINNLGTYGGIANSLSTQAQNSQLGNSNTRKAWRMPDRCSKVSLPRMFRATWVALRDSMHFHRVSVVGADWDGTLPLAILA